MRNGKIRVGLIGVGNIAQNSHLPAYLKREDVELAAVCDVKEERARQVADKYGIRHVAKDMEDLVALDDVDAVSICTWNNGHARAAIAAANAGKHILCEKPMAMNPGEAQVMLEAARKNKVIFMMGFVNRFRADSRLIKEMADAGRFGGIYHAKTGWLRRRGTPLGWFTDLSKAGGGPVIDIGVHVIDLTWYFMGKPKPMSVSATVHRKIGDYRTKGVGRWVAFDTDDLKFETEDSAAGLIRFENGASMSFEVSWALNDKGSDIFSHIYGDKAGASLNPLVIYSEEENYLLDSVPTIRQEDSFYNEISHFIECIKEGREPISTAEDGVHIQKILNGIYDSARLGKEILL